VNNKTFILVLVLVVGGMAGLFFVSGGKTETVAVERLGTEYEELPAGHVNPGQQTVPYNSIPATSGDHGSRNEYGEQVIDDYGVLHGMEHGAVSFWYNPATISEGELTEVRTTFETLPSNKRYLAARNDLGDSVKLAMASWGFALDQAEVNVTEMTDFFNANINKGPELAP